MDQDLSEFRPLKLWKRMTQEQRLAAAATFWQDEQSTEQQAEAIALIAKHLKFRTKSVLALPAEKRARYLASLPPISDAIVARALVSYHLERQRPMMSAFLDALGIAHEDGLISEETAPKPEPGKLSAAAAELAQKFAPADVTLYLSTLVSQDPDTWGALAPVAHA